jgi:hypothetical protein
MPPEPPSSGAYRTRSQAPPELPQNGPQLVEQPDQDEDVDEDTDERSRRGSDTGEPKLEQDEQDNDPGDSLSGRRAGNEALLAAAEGASLGPSVPRGASQLDAGRAATPRRRSASVGSRRVSPRGENDPLVFHGRGVPPAGPPPPRAGLPPPVSPSLYSSTSKGLPHPLLDDLGETLSLCGCYSCWLRVSI